MKEDSLSQEDNDSYLQTVLKSLSNEDVSFPDTDNHMQYMI